MPDDSKIKTDSNDNIILKLASGKTVVIDSDGLRADGINLGEGVEDDGDALAAALAASGGLKFSSGAIAVDPADIAGALLSDDGSDNLAVDESDIGHDSIDQSTVDADDHHDEDHAARHGAGGDDELATALRYEPESEPPTPDAGVVRWYDSGTDAFRAKFDDGSTVTLAEQ
jgi:hypothetical protein